MNESRAKYYYTALYVCLIFSTYSLVLISGCGDKEFTSVEKSQIQHFRKSMELRREARRIMNEVTDSQGVVGSISETDLINYVDKMKDALEESYQVSDNVLSKIHRDLPYNYRSNFVPCLEHQISGYSTHDAFAQKKGQLLEDKWVEWYSAHYQEFK